MNFTTWSVWSRMIDQEHRPKECDERSHRHVPSRAPATGDEDAKYHHRAHHLRQGENDESIGPAEGRAQHRHQLDVATAHAASAHDSDQEHEAATHERSERGLGERRTLAGQHGPAQRIRQARERDAIRDPAHQEIEDDDHGKRDEQRQKQPPPRGYAKSQEAQHSEAEGQSRTARERDRSADLGELAPYLVDGGAVGPGSGRTRGAR